MSFCLYRVLGIYKSSVKNICMKKIFFVVCVASMFTSCSVLRKSTATTQNVESSLTSTIVADLVVSNEKISYTYRPNKQDRKLGLNHVVNNAVAAALKANGSADVLVEKQYEAVYKVRVFGRKKIKNVTVTGYPATYKNFRSVNSK